MTERILLDKDYLPFGLAVASEEDRVGDHNFKFGYNAAVGTTAETVWLQGAAYTWNTAAALEVTSTDADDTDTTGAGARTVTIEGLDADYAEISETVELNGQTNDAGSTTTAAFLRVNRMYVATAGASATNEGTIYASTGSQTAGVPDVATTIRATIGPSAGQTLQALYTVPAGKTAYVSQVMASCADITNSAQIDFLKRELGGAWRTQHRFAVQQGSVVVPHNIPLVFPEKTDLEIQAASSAATVDVSASFDLLLR